MTHTPDPTNKLCKDANAIPPSPRMLSFGNDYYTCNKCGEPVDEPGNPTNTDEFEWLTHLMGMCEYDDHTCWWTENIEDQGYTEQEEAEREREAIITKLRERDEQIIKQLEGAKSSHPLDEDFDRGIETAINRIREGSR